MLSSDAEHQQPPGSIKIVIAEPTRIACQSLELAVSVHPEFRVLACATTANELAQAVALHEPDLAIIGSALEDGPTVGFRAVRECRLYQPRVRTIMLLEKTESSLVVDAFRAGAKGVFCRNDGLPLLYRCLRAVHAGQVWANSSELGYLLEALATSTPFRVVNTKGEELLSARELEVVISVAEGLSNREISEKLQLSEHTIKNYLFRIFDKLGISSRVELILYALSHQPALQAAAGAKPAMPVRRLAAAASTRRM